MIEAVLQSRLAYNLFIILAFLIVYAIAKRVINLWLTRLGKTKMVSEARVRFISRVLSSVVFFVLFSVAVISLGLGYSDISLFFSSAFAVLGVALFAQWSMLSNVTASVLIFFVFPYRIGDRVKVVDKDDDISGVINDITMFHVIIERTDGSLVTYPNNIILQKPVIKLTQLVVNPKPDNEQPEAVDTPQASTQQPMQQ
ncbi:mechanosensitive ion channel family protein [Photobacterium sp. 2_MG-2023]|uniref:Small-conductance mechanosensitive channel n=1 Tax=Photobacterium arenosum TaxID=2774143 RepID=A0ABR9BPW2_9GAMM|nr:MULTISPECIES: mechanosensitive ion channel family protein [Photobacterium]MBD8514600.1 mechanosensitive ion channel family protein [Photobacterium arenosum]MBV7264233.1 mechanosensitive ion channel family protein [Photobacterium sp. WH24]MDO6581558.1 mechanosensitive ion channel family protein [Photobacterium sp. 2_MG-2023]